MKRQLIACLSVVTVAALAGCGGDYDGRVPTFPASGQVLWEGAPLAGALVVLHPQSPADPAQIPARAETDAQGKFVLGTYESEDGVPTGDYRITVHFHPLQESGGSYEPGPDAVPPQYSDPEQSELRIQIAAGENQIPPLHLKR